MLCNTAITASTTVSATASASHSFHTFEPGCRINARGTNSLLNIVRTIAAHWTGQCHDQATSTSFDDTTTTISTPKSAYASLTADNAAKGRRGCYNNYISRGNLNLSPSLTASNEDSTSETRWFSATRMRSHKEWDCLPSNRWLQRQSFRQTGESIIDLKSAAVFFWSQINNLVVRFEWSF